MNKPDEEALSADIAKITELVRDKYWELSPDQFNAFLIDVANTPFVIANSPTVIAAFEAMAWDYAGSVLAMMFEESARLGRLRYGLKTDNPEIVNLAEDVRRVRNIDPKKGSPAEIAELSRYLERVKAATDKGDGIFFRELAEAVEMAADSQVPPAAREALYFAILVVKLYRRAGLTPRKMDVQNEVERMRSDMGRVSGRDGEGAKISWQRDIWKHPELAGVKGRKRGQAPVPLPDAWR